MHAYITHTISMYTYRYMHTYKERNREDANLFLIYHATLYSIFVAWLKSITNNMCNNGELKYWTNLIHVEPITLPKMYLCQTQIPGSNSFSDQYSERTSLSGLWASMSSLIYAIWICHCIFWFLMTALYDVRELSKMCCTIARKRFPGALVFSTLLSPSLDAFH